MSERTAPAKQDVSQERLAVARRSSQTTTILNSLVLDKDTVLEGNNLIKGSITSKGRDCFSLVVTGGLEVEGFIHTKSLTVHGDVKAIDVGVKESVEITGNAEVYDNFYAKRANIRGTLKARSIDYIEETLSAEHIEVIDKLTAKVVACEGLERRAVDRTYQPDYDDRVDVDRFFSNISELSDYVAAEQLCRNAEGFTYVISCDSKRESHRRALQWPPYLHERVELIGFVDNGNKWSVKNELYRFSWTDGRRLIQDYCGEIVVYKARSGEGKDAYFSVFCDMPQQKGNAYIKILNKAEYLEYLTLVKWVDNPSAANPYLPGFDAPASLSFGYPFYSRHMERAIERHSRNRSAKSNVPDGHRRQPRERLPLNLMDEKRAEQRYKEQREFLERALKRRDLWPKRDSDNAFEMIHGAEIEKPAYWEMLRLLGIKPLKSPFRC